LLKVYPVFLLGLTEFNWRHRSFFLWQHQCWGCEIVFLEADIQISSSSFWDYGYFFVWPPVAVPSKPSSQPIWLKVLTICNLTSMHKIPLYMIYSISMSSLAVRLF